MQAFEIRNYNFKGFSKGGQKGLWHSNAFPEDMALIVCEGAIDALSYHALHRPERMRYFSIAGEMNPMQRELLASAMKKLPIGGAVIAATDNNAAGVRLAAAIREIAGASGREDLDVMEHRPDGEGQDWNDVQRASAPEPEARAAPADGARLCPKL